MRGILPVLLIISTISIGNVLSFGSYFSEPYAKNIDTVVNLTRQICRDEEDDSAFPEGDVNETDEKLPEIRQQFHKMRKHFNAIKGKRDLRDRINDLRTENTFLQNALDKRSFPLTDEVKNSYSKYLGLHRILEKAVLDYLAMDKKDEEKRKQLVDEQMNPNEVMFELEKLFSETANFAKILLAWNEYCDKTFNLLYGLTKNHAILVSVAASFRKMTLIPFALENPDVFRAVLHDVRIQYQHYLNVIIETNQWREKNGFSYFTELYKYKDRNRIVQDIPMPHSTIQNNFLWDNETETFKPKYFYLSIKIPVYSQLRFRNCAYVYYKHAFGIESFVIRSQTHEKELVFYDQQTIADKFQKVVREKLKGIDSHDMVADELADNTGLIVLAITNNYMKYDDDLYTARGAYKLTLRTFFNQTKEECQKKGLLSTNECEEKHKTEEVITVPYIVIGYFLYGNQGTDVVKRQ